MTKLQNKVAKQLELRLLADVNARSEIEKTVEPEGRLDRKLPPTHRGASKNDLTVYEQISNNYFRSLRKG